MTNGSTSTAEEVEFEDQPVLEEIRENSVELESSEDLQPLVDRLKDTDYILMGEATHGTSEFYRWRAAITKKLIEEQQISFIGVEGDWPDCKKINDYVKNRTEKTGYEVLSEIERWPAWMWSNWEILEFIDWLRGHNEGLPKDEKVGFYGLDVYSLNDSMERVIDYLEKVDPEYVETAKEAYMCFEPHADGAEYAENQRMVPESCEDAVIEILSDIRKKQFEYEEKEGSEFFDAEQNALIARNAESYYRALSSAGMNSWNIRDRHMAETLERLMDREGSTARSVVWAHNTHVGDARATNMPMRGNLNIGQLVRERHKENVSIIGFSTSRGSVIAGRYWGDEPDEMTLTWARNGSWDQLMNEASDNDKIVFLNDADGLEAEKGHRAVGVVFHPENDSSNYVPTKLGKRYDHLVYLDETSALHPIKTGEEAEEPETYPWGL